MNDLSLFAPQLFVFVHGILLISLLFTCRKRKANAATTGATGAPTPTPAGMDATANGAANAPGAAQPAATAPKPTENAPSAGGGAGLMEDENNYEDLPIGDAPPPPK